MCWTGSPNADAAQDALKSVGKNSNEGVFQETVRYNDFSCIKRHMFIFCPVITDAMGPFYPKY